MSDATKLELLTTDQVAELLKVVPETVARWRHERKGPDYFRIGGKCLYTLAAIERWLATRQQAVEQ